jgi:hypothetical protein
MTRLHVGALCVAATVLHLPCLAGDTIPFPPLREGEWTIRTAVVLHDGQRSSTPESTIACIRPARKMQEDLDGMKRQGCIPRTTAVGEGSVSYAATCSGKDGEQLVSVSLTAPDDRSFHQVATMRLGTSELWGRWLGPCKPGTGEPGTR